MKRTPLISHAAHATLTRPLIFADGHFDRAAIFAKARREFRAGRARTWSAAMATAWALARRQLDLARDYDAARRAFYRSRVAQREPARLAPQYAA